MNNPLKNIRETQTRLRKYKTGDWTKLFEEKTGVKKSPGTIWYWEQEPDHPEARQADIRYLRFRCTEFNYNPAYVLGLVDEPEFNETVSEEDFPELSRIIGSVNTHPPLAIAFRSLLAKKDMGYVKRPPLANVS